MPRMANSSLSTPKQRRYVHYLAKQAGTSVYDALRENGLVGRNVDTLNHGEIGTVIDWLKRQAEKNPLSPTEQEEHLDDMKRPDLVRRAYEVFGKDASWILRATKEQLKDAIRSGVAPVIDDEAPKGASIDTATLQKMIDAAIASGLDSIDWSDRAIFTALKESQETLIANEVSKLSLPRSVVVTTPDNVKHEIGLAHRQFDLLVKRLAQGHHILMSGPAASFKTHSAHQAATALGLPFYSQSVSMQTTKSDLLGFVAADGRTVRTLFREAYENGGVFLLDEIDNGNANVLNVLNAATANDACPFPDAMVARHADFRLVAAANTKLTGADHMYVGRQVLDAALIDRFIFMAWEYDEALERTLAGEGVGAWVDRVLALRHALDRIPETSRPRVLITPRATFAGAKLIRSGESMADAEDACIWARCGADDRAMIEGNLR